MDARSSCYGGLMYLYAFRSGTDSEVFRVTTDPSGSRLPREHEPWKFWRLERIPSEVQGVDLAAAERDIKAKGFHLCRGLDTATGS